jgi:hypothetical protein
MRNTLLLPLLMIVPALLGGCGPSVRLVPVVLPKVATVIAITAVAGEIDAENQPVVAAPVEEAPRDFTQVDLNEPAFKATPPSALPEFSQATARAALDVDVSACRERGLPAGYGAASITFEPTGTVSRVTLRQPMSEDAQMCMRDAFNVTIPSFSGSAVEVPTRYFAR